MLRAASDLAGSLSAMIGLKHADITHTHTHVCASELAAEAQDITVHHMKCEPGVPGLPRDGAGVEPLWLDPFAQLTTRRH